MRLFSPFRFYKPDQESGEKEYDRHHGEAILTGMPYLPCVAPSLRGMRRIMTQDKVMGPVDYLMIRFPEINFSGKVVPELMRLEKKGIIRVIDLVLTLKDKNGQLTIMEAANLEGEAGAALNELSKNTREWFSEGDIEVIAETLPNNSAAALLLFENVWAIQFKKYLLEMNAELIDMGRIPPETIEKVEEAIMAQGGT
jgi:hypothetical protein